MTPPRTHPLPDIRPATFCGGSQNRLNNLRRFPELPTHLPDSNAYFVFSSSLQLLVTNTPKSGPLRPTLITSRDLPQPSPSDPAPLFLGVLSNVAYHAIRLSPTCDTHSYLATLHADHPHSRFAGLRSVAPHFTPDNASMAAHARALFEFHARHQYCGICASPTVPEHGGARRRCSRNHKAEEPDLAASDAASCNGMWFPRTDPAVIMLVLDSTGEKVLLGRQNRFPHGMFSCLAGFMEHGEGIDDAVRREVVEETGVRVGRVRFFGSQPWPFPYSLMLGCIAQAVDERIEVDEHELEEAVWFDRAAVKEMVERSDSRYAPDTPDAEKRPFVPPSSSIAGLMCASFAGNDPIASFETRAAETSGML